jgi:hypothetical protein
VYSLCTNIDSCSRMWHRCAQIVESVSARKFPGRSYLASMACPTARRRFSKCSGDTLSVIPGWLITMYTRNSKSSKLFRLELNLCMTFHVSAVLYPLAISLVSFISRSRIFLYVSPIIYSLGSIYG